MAWFTITTLGCKVNQYDGAAIAQALAAAGFRPLPAAAPTGPADALVVVNTCCVTAAAMAKSRQAIRRALRDRCASAVWISGCYADYDPQGLQRLLATLGVPPGRAVVAGHHDDAGSRVAQLASLLAAPDTHPEGPSFHRPDAGACPFCRNDRSMSARMTPSRQAGSTTSIIATRRKAAVKANCVGVRNLQSLSSFPGRQRAFVKVQDGCDAFCAYCVVPYCRAAVWSRGVDEVHRECARLVAAGHKEIVLCGVFLGAFGRATAVRKKWGTEPSQLPDLIRRVGAVEGLWRLRLSSLEPGDLTDELLEAYRDTPTAAWHFHLPLQSGSERILRRMNRQYAPADYRRAIERIRSAAPLAAVTTDVIVGFPGESDADFAATLEMARYAGFSKIHAFRFSAIRGTAAWTYRRQAPPPAMVKSRMAELAALERELAQAYRRQFVGTRMEALVESSRRGRPHRAMTDRYLTVFFAAGSVIPGDVVELEITGPHEQGLTGRLLGRPAPACPKPAAGVESSP